MAPRAVRSTTPEMPRNFPGRMTSRLILVLYLSTISIDAFRKTMGISGNAISIVYVITGVIYILMLPQAKARRAAVPRHLPLWLILLSLWCITEAVLQRIPTPMALLGWVSYVYFVPLLYIGADLLSNDKYVLKMLKVSATAGSIIGIGAIASAILGKSAPALLQPIVPAVGIHTNNATGGTVYLAPSIFATAERASENLLIALFACIALMHLPESRLWRRFSAAAFILIAGGLIAAERRADIYVAIAGIIALFSLSRLSPPPDRRFLPQTTVSPRRGLGFVLLVAAFASVALSSYLGMSETVSFLSSGSPLSRITYMFWAPNLGDLTGQGTGTSTQGLNLVGAISSQSANSQGTYAGYILNGRTFIEAEGSFSKTWLELGLVGVMLYGGIFFSALAPGIRSIFRLDGTGRALIILTMVLGIIFLKGHQSLDDPLIQPLFWLAAGGVWGRMRASNRPMERPGETGVVSSPAPDSLPERTESNDSPGLIA